MKLYRVTGIAKSDQGTTAGHHPHPLASGISTRQAADRIVAELASWGGVEVSAHGLGAYIATATAAGNYHAIVLGIATMSLFVVTINRLFWRPLYYYAERRFTT